MGFGQRRPARETNAHLRSASTTGDGSRGPGEDTAPIVGIASYFVWSNPTRFGSLALLQERYHCSGNLFPRYCPLLPATAAVASTYTK